MTDDHFRLGNRPRFPSPHHDSETDVQYLMREEEQLLCAISGGMPLDRILQKICEAVNCEIGNIVSVILLADAHCEEIANIGKSAAVFGLHRFLSAAVVGGDDEVLGSMEMYCCMPRRPCLNEIRVIERATCLAAIAIKRHQAAATASDTLEVCPDCYATTGA